MKIDDVRQAIDGVDREIIRLLDERAGLGLAVGRLKREAGLPLHNLARESEVLHRIRGMSDGTMPAKSLDNIFRAVMAETLALQMADDPGGCHGDGREGKREVPATVLENVKVAPGFYRMRLLAPELAGAFRPGQFFQLRTLDEGTQMFLRRPFAPAAKTAEGLTFFYAVVGGGTSGMAHLLPGSGVNILAPLGNGYSLLPSGSHALLIGGGCGGPSLIPLVMRLRENGVAATVLLGARNAAALLASDTFAEIADRLIVATDDGSRGCKGTIADAFRLERETIGAMDRVYACGPLPMLKTVAGLAEECGVDCEVSLEERMACGFGACMGCVAPVKLAGGGSAYRRVCHDGPVFKAHDLAWDEMRK